MTPRELLIRGVRELGIDLAIEQVNSIFIYLTELEKWNRKINLTAIRDEREVIIKHVLDSLAYLQGFRPAEGMKLLDMGSGAGFPALPLKIARPELSITMVESVKKKASFLRHIVRSLKLSAVDVVDTRMDELPEACQGVFDIVTARAFAEAKSCIAMGLPFLRQQGLIILSRGGGESISEPELDAAGVSIVNNTLITLPLSDYQRAIWVLRKR